MVLFYVEHQMGGNRTDSGNLCDGNINENNFSFEHVDAKIPKYYSHNETRKKRQAENLY